MTPSYKPDFTKVQAIVFDANAFKLGSLDLDFLKGWIRNAVELGLEIWMPEPVLWACLARSRCG
jgi:hypothetical protein